MSQCRFVLALPVLVAGVLSTMPAAQAADARHGLDLAKRWCATCHVVASDQQRGNPDVPPFAEVAKRPGFDAKALSNFLRAPHPQMPNMALSRAETDDIAAYIETLK